jgi:hypothetical protein
MTFENLSAETGFSQLQKLHQEQRELQQELQLNIT